MCRCTPNIRTPWCGRPGCEMPHQVTRVDVRERVALDALAALRQDGYEAALRACPYPAGNDNRKEWVATLGYAVSAEATEGSTA